ncbi:TetR/AcrR family transcriptional regulator [Psychrobacillus sp. INOP01]|uniref:TetR/AcrR family transcriptional regulator n=1 Tax=Psychrobacillus sp. INOP01 TaxID=2829187 RepID=UPI001BABB734|nr:TetR/AcrR family transcriptional regulator [Psychrobacillus sp. INOP01]QUG42992.1 TetR/AcrR family transcriptional regulator [Psychrobacillus sp. INOP01]
MNSENHSMGDRRIRRTKNLLKEHFVQLVKEKGYKNVTVTDIVEKADYNRSTFYLHFKDKEDIAEELVAEILKGLEVAFHQPFIDTKIVEYDLILPSSNTFFRHFYNNRNFYSLLNLEDTIPRFKEKFFLKFKEVFEGITYLNEANEGIVLEHFNTYKMYGSYGVILEWINGGCIQTPEEIADNLLEIFKTNSISFRFNKKS